jgi:hypothetical protein
MNSTAAVKDWETYLKDMTPCRFPRFSRQVKHAAVTALRQISSARVNVEQADKLLVLSTTDPDGLGAVLRTAWALLLRCYIGQDDVSFNYQHGGDADVAVDSIVTRFLLDDSASVAKTLKDAKTEVAGDLLRVLTRDPGSGRSGQSDLDTAVVLWSFTKRSTPCQVLNPVCRSFTYSTPMVV